MKGIVFTEFFEMVEEKFGYEMVDKIITTSNLESEGIYTAIGTYPFSEMVQLLMGLSRETKTDPNVLLKVFGEYLFNTFLKLYPQFFHNSNNTFDFLASIDDYIHVEVKKLYPDAALPSFSAKVDEKGNLELFYTSERKMGALAHGLIEKSIEYYNENLTVSLEQISEDGSEVKFYISKA
ncbi:MAG: heme NO-binding domain-containing protein [Balneolaceae bacterium]